MQRDNKQFYKVSLIAVVTLSALVIVLGCTDVRGEATNTSTSLNTSPEATYTAISTQVTVVTSLQPVTTRVVPTVTPHFTGTITFGNHSFALTEDQAWKYAAAYLQREFKRDQILPSEIEPWGQSSWEFANGTQTMTWGFTVHKTTEDGKRFEGVRVTINAYTGDVLDVGVLD